MTEPNDYTALPVGTKTAKGEVVVCPYCKQNGLLVTIGGKNYYNHRIGSFLTPDKIHAGKYITNVVEESCPRTSKQREEHEAAQPK